MLRPRHHRNLRFTVALAAAFGLLWTAACTSDTAGGTASPWTDDCTLQTVTSNSISGTLVRDADGLLTEVGAYSFTYEAGKLSAIEGPSDRAYTGAHTADEVVRSNPHGRVTYTLNADGRVAEMKTEDKDAKAGGYRVMKRHVATWQDGNLVAMRELTAKGALKEERTYAYSAAPNPLAGLDPVIVHTVTLSPFLASASFIAVEKGDKWTNTYNAVLGDGRYVTAVKVTFDGMSWTPLADATFVFSCR